MIRIFDFIFSFFGILFLSPVMLVLYIIGLFDTGSPIFKQERVGIHKKPFNLYKFRTMNVNAKQVATHLANTSEITKFGAFLRSSTELIEERDSRGVYNSKPGITGLAQINEIDMSTPRELAIKDAEMLESLTVADYFKYIFATVGGKGQGDRIRKGQ